jgi:hypothetical protein
MSGSLNHQWISLRNSFTNIILLFQLISGFRFLNPTGRLNFYDRNGTNWFMTFMATIFCGSWCVVRCVDDADIHCHTTTCLYFSPNARYGGRCRTKPGSNPGAIILQLVQRFHMRQCGIIPCLNDTCNDTYIVITPAVSAMLISCSKLNISPRVLNSFAIMFCSYVQRVSGRSFHICHYVM